MIYHFDFGYTPNNLRKLIEVSGIERKEAWRCIGKSRSAFERYMHDYTEPTHVSMKHEHWVKLLNHIQSKYIIIEGTAEVKAVFK